MTIKTDFITIEEASEITNLSVTTLRRGVKEGRFPAVRIGGERSKQSKLLFDRQMLLKALQYELLSNVKDEQRRSFLLSQDEEDKLG